MHFYHSEVGAVVWTAFFNGAAAALGAACSAPSGPVVPMCFALVAVADTLVLSLFQTAFNRGGGIVLEFNYDGILSGYMYVGDNWT